MPERLLRFVFLVGPAAIAAAVVVVRQPPAVAFGVAVGAYVLAHVFAVPTRSGRHVSFVPAVAAATALLTQGSLLMVLGAGCVAFPFGRMAVHVTFGRRAVDDTFPAQPIALAAFAGVCAAMAWALGSPTDSDPLALAMLVPAAAVWFVTEAVARAIVSEQGRFTVRRLVVLKALGDWPAYLAVFAAAALFASTVRTMGVWSVPLAGLPYVFSHVSLLRLRDTDRTHRETMVALSRIPEAAGLVDPGHAERCADLSVTLGAEVGLSVGDLHELEYAALLHDIGKVVLANPVIAATDPSPTDISTWSAAIIAETSFLQPVAEMVSAQNSPYRRPGESRDESVPSGAQVLRVVASYDGRVAGGATPTESLEQLHQGAAYDYDPDLVSALRRVLSRRGTIPA